MSNQAQSVNETPLTVEAGHKAELGAIKTNLKGTMTADYWLDLVRGAVVSSSDVVKLRDRLASDLNAIGFPWNSIFVIATNGNSDYASISNLNWQNAYVTYNGKTFRAYVVY